MSDFSIVYIVVSLIVAGVSVYGGVYLRLTRSNSKEFPDSAKEELAK